MFSLSPKNLLLFPLVSSQALISPLLLLVENPLEVRGWFRFPNMDFTRTAIPAPHPLPTLPPGSTLAQEPGEDQTWQEKVWKFRIHP